MGNNAKIYTCFILFCLGAIAGADDATIFQERLRNASLEMLKNKKFQYGESKFNKDCSGTILAIYKNAGFSLEAVFLSYHGSGVRRIFDFLHDRELTFTDSNDLEPGDIIFWDNSYDKNNDGQWNDKLTHIGLVTDIDADETITFIHYHSRLGVRQDLMNLKYPKSRTLNSIIRIAHDQERGHLDQQTTAQLFSYFAKPSRLWVYD